MAGTSAKMSGLFIGTEAYGEKWPALPYDATGLPGSSLSKIVTSKPFFCKNNALEIPWIPAPIIPILNLLIMLINIFFLTNFSSDKLD